MWRRDKRTGEIWNGIGSLIAKTEFGQRHHTNLLGEAQEMQKLLIDALPTMRKEEPLLAEKIQRSLNRQR